MNKDQLINSVAERTGATRAMSRTIIDAALDSIVEAAAAKEYVSLVGFGTFECRNRKPRIAHSPMTGEAIQVPARTVVVFRAGKRLKEAAAGK